MLTGHIRKFRGIARKIWLSYRSRWSGGALKPSYVTGGSGGWVDRGVLCHRETRWRPRYVDSIVIAGKSFVEWRGEVPLSEKRVENSTHGKHAEPG